MIASRRANIPITVIVLTASIVLIFSAISNQSIWIDEAMTANYARMETSGELFRSLWRDKKSEAQMPLGMYLAFLGEKLFGHSEYALRIPNLLWLSLGIWAFALIGKRIGAVWLPLLLAVHPMVWHYADEARPYALQIGLAALLLWATAGLMSDRRVTGGVLAAFWLSAIALCATSLLAAIIFTGWLAVLLVICRDKIPRISPGQKIFSTAALLALTLIGIYYLSTIWRGAGGARYWDVSLANLLFVGFEFGGFMGFSPGRIVLRTTAQEGIGGLPAVLRPYLAPLVGLAAVYLFFIARLPAVVGRAGDNRDRSLYRFCLAAIGICGSGLWIICYIVRFPFWGRHLVPLLPPVLLLLAGAALKMSRAARGILVGLLLALLLAGSINQRFNKQHQKDDYRTVAALARAAEDEGKSVFWAACLVTAAYYDYEPALHYPADPGREDWRNADMVVYSKADLFDPAGHIRRWLDSAPYKLSEQYPAFTIWVREE